MTQLQPLSRPMTLDEIRAAQDDAGYIKAVISVSLCELISYDLEEFNDLIEERTVEHGILSDIGYKVVDQVLSDDGSSDVLIEVTAEVDLSSYEDMDEETIPSKQ